MRKSTKVLLTGQSRDYYGDTREYEPMSYTLAEDLGVTPHKRMYPEDKTITDTCNVTFGLVPFQSPKSRRHQGFPGRETSVSGGYGSCFDFSSVHAHVSHTKTIAKTMLVMCIHGNKYFCAAIELVTVKLLQRQNNMRMSE